MESASSSGTASSETDGKASTSSCGGAVVIDEEEQVKSYLSTLIRAKEKMWVKIILGYALNEALNKPPHCEKEEGQQKQEVGSRR